MSDQNWQTFNVAVVNTDDDSETITPMKTWLRQHPDRYPFDPSAKNSRTIGRWLIQQGWRSKETPTEFRLYPPESPPPPEFIDDGGDPPPDEPSGSFRLEAELRDFLANNLHLVRVGERRLHLYVDQNQRNGVEYPTATGPIDILATDDQGAFYVFELKRATSPDSAIGQLARYIGWAIQNLANGKPVYGLIVAKEITDRLKYSVLAMQNVSLFEYKVAFTLKPITQAAV
jgi:hypothetical protein